MGSSLPKRLTPLQRDLLEHFFRREGRFFVTGGGALAGFYFGHRDTEDIDLFSAPGPDLREAAAAMMEAARACGAAVQVISAFEDFHRMIVTRGEERCLVDLVIDRAAAIDSQKNQFGNVRVDTLREIAANKICTLIGRSEIKDLVDLRSLLDAGIDLRQAFDDAQKKERSADPATLAWVLDQIAIGPTARLPGGVDPNELDRFRKELVRRLRTEAFDQTRR